MRKNGEFYRLESMRWYDNKDEDYAYDVSMGIVNLGTAQNCSDAIAKVQVNIDEPINSFQLFIDPNKFSDFTTEQRAGVVWHELNHIIHKHLGMSHKDTTLGMSDREILTMAQEIVCNDTVLYNGVDLPHMDSIFTGEKYLGENTFPKSTKEVYDMIKQKQEDGDETVNNALESIAEGNDPCDTRHGIVDENGSPIDMDGIFNMISGESDENESSGGNTEDIEDIIESIKESVDKAGEEVQEGMDNQEFYDNDGTKSDDQKSSKGNGQGDATLRSLDTNDDISMSADDWVNFLKAVDPRIDLHRLHDNGMMGFLTQESDWSNQPIYMYSTRSSGISGRLPSMKPHHDEDDGEDIKPSIVFAIDQSGSIDEKVAKTIVSLVKYIPLDKVDAKVCVYASLAGEVDLTNKDSKIISSHLGWGTEFSSIDDFVKTLDVDYNNTTIVNFTDGEAHFTRGIPTNIDNYVFVDLNSTQGKTPFSSMYYDYYNWVNKVNKDNMYSIHDVYPDFYKDTGYVPY